MTRGEPRRVLVSTSSFGRISPAPLERLEGAGFEVRVNPHGRVLEPAETVELLSGSVGVVAGTEALDRAVLERAPGLRVISRCGAGLENVDLEAAAELGIRVFATPEAPAPAVAELALAGILCLLRHVGAADRDLKRGEWRKPMGRLLSGKTVGIVGLGNVGRALAALLVPFSTRILACDPAADAELARRHGATLAPLDELLAEADVVTLHLPYGPATHHLLDGERLDRMKRGALLVNCARGGLVDEAALFERLRDGSLAGAHLDVFEEEPYRGPLAELSNVLLTPHIGSYAAESRLRMESEAVENLIGGLAEGES